MPAIPLTGKTLQPFHQGAQFEYGPITINVAATLPDPDNWTSLLLAIHEEGGTDVESDAADAVIPPSNTGSGPWVVTAYFPIIEAQSASLSAGAHTFRLIIETAAGRDVLVEGLVQVLEMHAAEWPV